VSDDKTRRPDLPPVRETGFGAAAGDPCGVVRGSRPPCPDPLRDEGDGVPRCPRHCRAPTRNQDSLSALCPQWRMRGRRGCKRHGGATRAGALHPRYSGGRTSRWSPFVDGRYADLARAVAFGDPLDLLDDIELTRARIASLLEGMPEGGFPDFAAALPLCGAAEAAVRSGDPDRALRLLGDLGLVLSSARGVERSWDKVDELFGRTTKMVESQRKRNVEGGRYVLVEDAMEMFRGMAEALKRTASEILPKAQADRLLTGVNREWSAMQGVDSHALEEEVPAS